MIPYCKPLCFSAVFLSVLHSHAAEDEELPEEMVVTGTRTPKTLIDSPVKIDVVSGVQLRKVSQSTLGRALNFMPGVVAKRSEKDGYTVYLQGYSANRVLILLNGQPLITPTGSEVDLDQISVADIERVEILRGAGSVLYGSSAMGGVINIITSKTFDKSLSLNSQLYSYKGKELEGDEYGIDYRLQGKNTFGKAFAKFNLQVMDDPGFTYDPDTVKQEGIGMEKNIYQAEVGYVFDPLIASYRAQYLEEDRTRPDLAVQGRVISYVSEVEQTMNDLSFAKNIGSSGAPTWKLNLRHAGHDEISGNVGNLRKADISILDVDSQKVWMGKGYELVGGLAHKKEELEQIKFGITQAEVPQETAERYEGFLQYNLFGKGWDWLIGGRYQYDTKFDSHTAFRMSGLKTFETGFGSLRFRSGLGQSYRVPNLKELYFMFDHSNLGYVVEGNENLKPETALTGSFGVTWTPSFKSSLAGLEFEFNAHYSESENLIDTVNDLEATVQRQLSVNVYKNFEETEISGFDLAINLKKSRFQSQLNYSYLEALDALNNRRLPNRPRHQLKANLSYSVSDSLSVILYGVHEQDEQPASDRFISVNEVTTVNFSIEHQINRLFRWQFGVDNMFDEHGSTENSDSDPFDLRPISSREIFIGFTLNLI